MEGVNDGQASALRATPIDLVRDVGQRELVPSAAEQIVESFNGGRMCFGFNLNSQFWVIHVLPAGTVTTTTAVHGSCLGVGVSFGSEGFCIAAWNVCCRECCSCGDRNVERARNNTPVFFSAIFLSFFLFLFVLSCIFLVGRTSVSFLAGWALSSPCFCCSLSCSRCAGTPPGRGTRPRLFEFYGFTLSFVFGDVQVKGISCTVDDLFSGIRSHDHGC